MLLSAQRLIFIHIPKNAGQSIEAFFGRKWRPKRPPEDPPQEPWPEFHKRHTSLRRYFKEPGFESYRSFAIVRNPWDRMVSCYTYEMKRAKQGIGLHRSNRRLLAKGISFSDYLTQADYETVFLRSQSSWLQDKKGQLAINEILRFENLAEDFKRFALSQGLPAYELPHVNPSDHAHYSTYYSAESIALIAEKYQRDILNFGYSFEHPTSK